MSSEPSVPTIRGQLITCALLCALAAAIVLLAHPEPKAGALLVGLPVAHQLGISFAFAACAATAAWVALSIPRLRRAIPAVPASVQAIDLSGSNPLRIGLAAGVGEELLFRAALQPLAGLWWASAIFAVAHIRTATLAGSAVKKIAYLAHVLMAGVALGVVYRYVGLLAAILIHATIDVVSLASLQRLKGIALLTPPAERH